MLYFQIIGFITRNGKGGIVVMSIEAYEKREAMLDLREKILHAEAQRLSAEPTISLEDAEKRMQDKIRL